MPLLFTRRFLPLLLTQFLGALNDNFFKTAVVMLVTYRYSATFAMKPDSLVIWAGALYMTPYILFCAIGGKLADKFDKVKIARIIKLFEVGFMLLAALGFYLHQPVLLFLVLFCMGVHSALFSPPKYALIPEHLREDELIEGNAFMEGGTFIASLLGTIVGGALVLRPHGELLVSSFLLLIAVTGVICSRFILPSAIRDRSVRLSFNLFAETWAVLSYVTRHPSLLKASLANSWFYFIAITFALLLAPYARSIGANEEVGTLLLTSFTVGIGAGTVMCGALMKGPISMRAVALCAFGMSVFIFDFYRISPASLEHPSVPLLSLSAFFASMPGWRHMVFDLVMTAFSGGMFIVPLYAALQRQSPPEHRAQVMACNNVVNALFMIAAAFMALFFFAFGGSIALVFLTAGILNTAVVILLLTPAGRIEDKRLAS